MDLKKTINQRPPHKCYSKCSLQTEIGLQSFVVCEELSSEFENQCLEMTLTKEILCLFTLIVNNLDLYYVGLFLNCFS